MPEYHTSDGTRLFYRDEGSGPPLLCLAGLTRNGTDFDYVMPYLTGRRVIRLDYRGRGQSDWADPASYTIPTEAADVVMLLDHLGIKSVPVIGTSRGGLIGMTLAATARDRLHGLCLVDIGPELSADGLTAIAGYVGKSPKAKTFAEAAAMRADLMAGFQGVSMERWMEEAQKHFVATDAGLTINYDPRLAEVFKAADRTPMPDLWPLFDALAGMPVAVIRGADSDLLAASTVEEMAARRPDLIAATVPDRGHVPFLDEPAALAAIRTWLGHIA